MLVYVHSEPIDAWTYLVAANVSETSLETTIDRVYLVTSKRFVNISF